MTSGHDPRRALDEVAARARELGLIAIRTDQTPSGEFEADLLDRVRCAPQLPGQAFRPFELLPDVLACVGPKGPLATGIAICAVLESEKPFACAYPAEALVRYPPEIARRVLGTLSRMFGDLLDADALQAQTESFTNHLAQSYENMTLLYRLGRSMNELRHPEQFVTGAVEGLADTLGYLWTSVVFAERREVGELAGRFISAHDDLGLDDVGLRGLLDHFVAKVSYTPGEAPAGVFGCEGPLGPEVVLQPIRIDNIYAGYMAMGSKRGEDCQATSYDTQALEAVAGYVSTMLESVHLYAEQQATLMGMLRALSTSLDAKDRYTRGHSERVALLAKMLAQAAGLPEHDAERIHLAGILHDIGKIGVPDHVLCKPSRLTDEEFALIKQHPTIGYEILKGIPAVEDVLPGVLHHHERWDGRGYPGNIGGESIPLMARILALADTFDSMSSNRAYRAARHREQVLAEIQRCSGGQFDPDLVDAFLTLDFLPFDQLIAKHSREKVDTQDAFKAFKDAKAEGEAQADAA